MTALTIGYILDLIIGDPHNFFHPVRCIGKLIEQTEKFLRGTFKNKKNEAALGAVLWITVVGLSFFIPFYILKILFKINILLSKIVEGVMCYYILAAKSLKDESMNVYDALNENNIAEARRYLSYIVGRDVENLNFSQIAKAAVETISENTSDGVIAPMIFFIIGGAPFGFMYKAVNTLDSMVGYKNDKYVNFGMFSAKADDAFNYIPSRLSAYLMIASSFILRLDYKSAVRIYKRDRFNHESPNSAQTESVCAGALNIMLGGSSTYGGVAVRKPTIGDDIRQVEAEDIIKANKLMYTASFLCFLTGVIVLRFI